MFANSHTGVAVERFVQQRNSWLLGWLLAVLFSQKRNDKYPAAEANRLKNGFTTGPRQSGPVVKPTIRQV